MELYVLSLLSLRYCSVVGLLLDYECSSQPLILYVSAASVIHPI